MLLSAVVRLEVSSATDAPAVLGRAAHAWILKRISRVDDTTALSLHDREPTRPITVSNLMGAGRARGGRVSLEPGRLYWLRITALNEETSVALASALPGPAEKVCLAGAHLVVKSAITDGAEHPWAGRTTYAELAQHHTLRSEPPPRAVVLRFSSPTLFRSAGRDLPLPEPSLVFGSYLRRWNQFSPVLLPEEALRYAKECVGLGRFGMRSHLVSFEEAHKGAHVGFTGQARFRFLVGDPYWMRMMRLLAGYAFWCGTGYRTTVGLGQTRAID